MSQRPKHDLVICFTSLPERIGSPYFRDIVLPSLLSQGASRVQVAIPYELNGKKYPRPPSPLIHIPVPFDFGPATKVLGHLDSIADGEIVAICDDDLMYRKGHFNELAHRLIQHEATEALVVVAHIIRHSEGLTVVCGYGGWVCRGSTLKLLRGHPPEGCWKADDEFISHQMRLNSVTIVEARKVPGIGMRGDKDYVEHPAWEELNFEGYANSKNCMRILNA